MLLFNYVVGATDAHAKNYSVLHLANDETVLAPMYDVASALPYIPRLGNPWRSAMSIGGENRIGRLHRSHLVKFAESVSLPAEGCCGLAGEVAQRVLDTEESVFNEEAGVRPAWQSSESVWRSRCGTTARGSWRLWETDARRPTYTRAVSLAKRSPASFGQTTA